MKARSILLGASALTFAWCGVASAQTGAEITLPTIQIEGTSNKDVGYVAPTTTAATKTSTPWIETPQSVSTVTQEQIRDQKPMSLDEIVRYAPGVRGETFGQDFRNDWFLLRGFTSQNEAIFLDGM